MSGSLSSVPEVADEVVEMGAEAHARTPSGASSSASFTPDDEQGQEKNQVLDITKQKPSTSVDRQLNSGINSALPRSHSLDTLMTGPSYHTIQTVHTTPNQLPIKLSSVNEDYTQERILHSQQQQQYEVTSSQPPTFQSSVYSNDTAYQPRTVFTSRSLPQLPGQHEDISQQRRQSQLYQQQQYQQQYQQQQQQQQQHAHDTPLIPPRPQSIASSPPTPIHPFQRLSIVHAPQTLDPNEIALLASSPTASSHSGQPSFESIPQQLSSPPRFDRVDGNSRNLMEGDPGFEYVHESRNLQQESETKLKSLEMKLRRSQDQTLAYAKKNHALARESLQMSTKIMNRAMLIQNKVQAVLTQNHELHENPTPRLFIVLPVLILDQAIPTKPTATGDQRKFRLHFLCECGQYTRPLPTSGLNHIHFVDHDGYEIIRPAEFFEKYGAFIRSLSHLIRKGVHCGSVTIPPLLGLPEQQYQYSHAYPLGQETLKNQILDTRLTESIEYLDSLETPDLDSSQDLAEYFDGTDIRQLQAYIKIPPQDVPCLANFYRIVTNRGYVKWICEDHYRSTIHYQNELMFQKDITALGGDYDLRRGMAKVQLGTAQDANQFYKTVAKPYNLHELNVELKWQFNEGELSKFVQAINDSKVRVLTLDGCRQKADSSMSSIKIMNFGKKYDIIFGSKIGSLKLINIPSMMLKISTKPQHQPLTQAYGIKALHLENVGMLDSAGSEKAGHSLGNLNLNNGPPRTPPLTFLANLLTNFHSLSEISVPGMNIRDDGISLLTEQTPLQKTLRRINFYNNAISPTGGRLLARFISREKSITHLDLGMNAIGDEVLVQVIDALGPKLSVLNLESTGFRESAAKALERLVATYNNVSDPEPHLQYLNLASNAWTTSSIQALGRIIARLRIENPPPSSPSVSAPLARKGDKAAHLEMVAAEAFLVVNSMIRTSQISLPTDKPWYQQPDILNGHSALTATKESYNHPTMKAQDSITSNSKFKVLRIMDAGLSEGAAR
ncbi:hypothetical protein BGX27_004583, partial [Mortierella sp. AM989]